MALLSTFGREGPLQLSQHAEQLEQLAAFMNRPDGRIHLMERAAECRARAILIQARIVVGGLKRRGMAKERGGGPELPSVSAAD
jgi:hypothetical protein